MNLRLILLLGSIGWGSAVHPLYAAGPAENPYTPIVTRNVFGLVPIPVGTPAEAAPATPPPKITPNGIMTIFGKLQALYKVAEVAKPGQPAKEESYVSAEGERQDDIEVQKIDEQAATVTFNNHGTIQTLPLVVGVAIGGAPAPAAAGPLGAAPGARPTIPKAPGAAIAPIGFGGRLGRNSPGQNPGGIGGAANGREANNGAAASNEALTPEARVIVMEAQRAQWLKEGNPAAAIIPPSPVTQEVIDQKQPAGGGPPVP